MGGTCIGVVNLLASIAEKDSAKTKKHKFHFCFSCHQEAIALLDCCWSSFLKREWYKLDLGKLETSSQKSQTSSAALTRSQWYCRRILRLPLHKNQATAWIKIILSVCCRFEQWDQKWRGEKLFFFYDVWLADFMQTWSTLTDSSSAWRHCSHCSRILFPIQQAKCRKRRRSVFTLKRSPFLQTTNFFWLFRFHHTLLEGGGLNWLAIVVFVCARNIKENLSKTWTTARSTFLGLKHRKCSAMCHNSRAQLQHG